MVDLDLPQGCTQLPIPSKQLIQSSVFAKLSSLNITCYSTVILPCHQLSSVRIFYFKVQIHLEMLKRCFVPPRFVHTDLFKPLIGVKNTNDNMVHTSPSNCSPASNSSASIITASYSKCTKFNSSGYIKIHSFWS